MSAVGPPKVTVTPSGINKSVTVTDCHCNSSYKMTHIEAESINIWLRYDPKCNLAICKDSGVKYELRKRLKSENFSKKSISGVNFDI